MDVLRLTFVIATSVVACFLLYLAAHLLYVLWWRRRFHSEYAASAAGSEALGDPYTSPSKELLYFLCWKTHSRIEPAAAVSTPSAGARSPAPPLFCDGDSLKLQGVNGPSRFLFTIREEKEDSEAEETKLPETEKTALKECILVGMEDAERGVGEETPFATPCASPLFYTPQSSPPRFGEDAVGKMIHSPDDDGGGGKYDVCLRVVVD